MSVRRLVAGTAGLFCIIACSLFLLPPAAPPALASPPAPLQLKIPPQRGDRNLQETLVFPQDVLSGSGGRVIDITRPPYNARGDGVTDNTQAFLAVYDDILAGLERHATGKSMAPGLKPMWFQKEFSPLVYIPDGTYLVSDTIIYSGPPRMTPNGVSEFVFRIRFIGQSREKTIIRLADRSPGFSGSELRPVLSFAKHAVNHSPAQNVCRNLTIDIGYGNPKAVGIKFAGANLNEIGNLLLRSGDLQGGAGILFDTQATQGWFHDITVEGFDYGVLMKPYHATQLTFEHITLRDQQIAGMETVQSPITVRDLVSINRGPAIRVLGRGGQVVLLDSWLGTDSSGVAVQVEQGQLFARRVLTPGYASSIAVNGLELKGSEVAEFVSSPVLSLWGGDHSLDLPIEEAPLPRNVSPEKWAVVDRFGARGDGQSDDSEAVQKAMDSGASVVCFPKMEYRISTPINVPASVERIELLFGTLSNATFVVGMNSPRPLVIRDGAQIRLRHQAPRTVLVSNVFSLHYSRLGRLTGHKLFANGCSAMSTAPAGYNRQRVWFRQVNSETQTQPANFKGSAVDMWVLGFKCEGSRASFEVDQGSRLEILGGLINQPPFVEPANSAIVARDSDVSVVAHTNLSRGRFRNLLSVWENGRERVATYANFVPRGRGPYEVIVPLAVSRLTRGRAPAH